MRRLRKLIVLSWLVVSPVMFVSSMIDLHFSAVIWVASFMLAIVITTEHYPEVYSKVYWRSRLRWLKFWPSKPRVYPHNINDVVAEEYRRRLFRK